MSQRSSTGSSTAKKRRGTARSAAGGVRVLHLEPFSGIAGNMFVGALLDAGLSRKQLQSDLDALGLDFRLRITRVQRGALAARHFDVLVADAARGKAGRTRRRSVAGRDQHQQQPHGHEHAHDHDHAHGHGHTHPAGHTHGPGRTHRAIVEIIETARLEPAVCARALAIYQALAEAEAHVHGIPVERVHFHEVGAIDAIVDVTAAAIGLHRLGIEYVSASPPALGHGHVHTAHGELPLPAPATLELLRGIPTVPAEVAWETVTPTGAAILRACVDEFRTLPALTPEAIGYGAGSDRDGPMPNVLRAVVGRKAALGADRVAVLEANLDDLVPEHFDYLMERLLGAGALDVGLQHLQMKKNRPGFLVRVLARPADRVALAGILFAETTTIGVRSSEWDRLVLEREVRRCQTAYGRVRVKCVTAPDGHVEMSPEYDDCKRAAEKHGVPLREVVREAERAARETLA